MHLPGKVHKRPDLLQIRGERNRFGGGKVVGFPQSDCQAGQDVGSSPGQAEG